MNIIPKERYKSRMKTCLKCPSYDSRLNRCKECGCFLILKAAMKSTICPLDKWKEND